MTPLPLPGGVSWIRTATKRRRAPLLADRVDAAVPAEATAIATRPSRRARVRRAQTDQQTRVLLRRPRVRKTPRPAPIVRAAAGEKIGTLVSNEQSMLQEASATGKQLA